MTGKLKKILLFSAFALLLFFAGAFLILAPMGKTETANAVDTGDGDDRPIDESGVSSGTWGDNITWEVVEEGDDTVLYISGTGAIADFENGIEYTDGSWNVEEIRKGVTKLVISSGITSLGNYAFRGFVSVTSVSIPDSVTYIGQFAISYCRSLTSIVIPDSVTFIDSGAFSQNNVLSSVTIPASVTGFGTVLLSYTPVANIYYKGTLKQWCEIDSSFDGITNQGSADKKLYINGTEITGDLVIPEGTTKIAKYAFSTIGITSVTIPDSVTSIEPSAFSGCTGLTSVTIPEGVTSIGGAAFYNCTGLTSITILEGVTSIGNSAFSGCTGLTSLTIPEGVTSIGDYAFRDCTGLTSLTIPEGITKFNSLCYGCTALTKITIPDSVTSITQSSFYNCTALTTITIGSKLTSITGSAFNKTPAVTKVYLNNTKLSKSAFYSLCQYVGTSGVTKIYVPAEAYDKYVGYNSANGRIIVGNGEFGTWGSLDWDFMPSTGELSISGTGAMDNFASSSSTDAWRDCLTNIKSVVIGSGVTSVSDYALYGATNLTSVELSATITEIGTDAFSGTALTDIYVRNTNLSSDGLSNLKDGNSATIRMIKDAFKAEKYQSVITANPTRYVMIPLDVSTSDVGISGSVSKTLSTIGLAVVLADSTTTADEVTYITYTVGSKDPITVENENGTMPFTIDVTDMDKTVTIEMYDKYDDVILTKETSFKAYLTALGDDYSGVSAALLNYGAAAQVHQGMEKTIIDGDVDTAFSDEGPTAPTGVDPDNYYDGEGNGFTALNIVYSGNFKIKFKFAVADISKVTVKINNEEVSYSAEGDKYSVLTGAIAPKDIETAYTAKIYVDGVEKCSITYSVADYVYNVNTGYYKQATKNLVVAIWNLQVALNALA